MEPYGCARCDNRWGGFGTCHCSYCHHTFTGLTAFDKHRQNSRCVNPQKAGLELSGRKYPCWAMPGTDPRWDEE